MSQSDRGWLFRLTWPVTHYVVTNLCVMLGLFLFRVLNRTTVIGKSNVPQAKNTLLLSNHQTMIDSFLVGGIAFFPRSLLDACMLPWSPAAAENFYRNPVLAWFSDNWKCIPVKKGRKDVGALFRMSEALRTGTMLIFPEGTRSRDSSIGKARGGAGMVILETQPTVIPVCIEGVNEVLPIGVMFPRLFKRIYLYFGEPLDLSEYYGKEKNKEASHAIMQHVMERIREMQVELKELKKNQKSVVGNSGLINKESNSTSA